MFLLTILIPACESSSWAFLMMYSVYKLNKQGSNIQPWHTPFPIWNQSVAPCLVLTVASWSAYIFLRRQVRLSGIPISWRIVHSVLWSTTLFYSQFIKWMTSLLDHAISKNRDTIQQDAHSFFIPFSSFPYFPPSIPSLNFMASYLAHIILYTGNTVMNRSGTQNAATMV